MYSLSLPDHTKSHTLIPANDLTCPAHALRDVTGQKVFARTDNFPREAVSSYTTQTAQFVTRGVADNRRDRK